jgi:hypothetical protein
MPHLHLRFCSLPLITVAASLACKGSSLDVPTTGSLEVTASTTGSEPDPDGYTVQVDDGTEQAIAPAGVYSSPDLSSGNHTVQLGGIATNCAVAGGRARTVDVRAGEKTMVPFEITCSGNTGALQVNASTTGTELDPDGYVISLDGTSRGTLGASGGFVIQKLIPGDHVIDLGGVASNCIVAAGNQRTVKVSAGVTSGVYFAISCSSTATGIAFGTMYLDNTQLSTVQNGALRVVDPGNFLSELSGARARGARLIIKLVGSGDRPVKNGDGTFSFTKWKALVDGFHGIDFGPYLADGTIVGHYLIDEPDVAARWGGQIISQATIEAMAQYSKQLWPGMATMVRARPSWLAQAPISYTHLDAGMVHYTARRGDPTNFLAGEVTIAKRLGLKVGLSMNLLDGGDGSSGIPGFSSGKYAMSADELRRYGSALLRNDYGCAFLMWKYDAAYYARSDIQSAMADLSNQARNHPRTPCRQ